MKRLLFWLLLLLLVVCLCSCMFTDTDREIIIDTIVRDISIDFAEDNELVDVLHHHYWGLFPGTTSYYIYKNSDGVLTAIEYERKKTDDETDLKTYTISLYDATALDRNSLEVVADDKENIESEYYTLRFEETIYLESPYELDYIKGYVIQEEHRLFKNVYSISEKE